MPNFPNPFLTSEEEDEQRQQGTSQPQPSAKREPTTPAEAAQMTQPAQKSEGFITQTGEFIEGAANVLNPMNYAANLIDAGQNILEATGAKDTLAGQFLDSAGEIFKTQQELDAERTATIQRIQAGDTEGIPEGQVAAAGIVPKVDAAVGAMAETPYLPLTLAARVANQDASWANKPASISDDDPLADFIYDTTRVLAPTLVLAPVTGGLSIPAATAIESAVETIPQDSAEDLIAGRQLAQLFGEIYDARGLNLGYKNGTELTQALIRGDDLKAQAILGVWGFGQNYGINWSATKTMQLLGPQVKKVFTKGSEWIAERLGREIEEVEAALTNIPDPKYTTDKEPSSAVDLNTAYPRALSPSGNYINDVGLMKRILRDIEDLPEVERVPGEFFFDLSKISKASSVQEALRMAFGELQPFDLGQKDYRRIQKKTLAWLIQNIPDLKEDPAKFMSQYLDDFTLVTGDAPRQVPMDDLDEYIRTYHRMEYGKISQDDEDAGIVGIAVARYILEDLGYGLQKLSTQMDDMLQRGESIDDLMNNVFLPMERYTQTLAYPFRRAGRDWFLRGSARKPDFLMPGSLDEYLKGDLDNITIDGMPTVDTIKDLWESAQAGDEQALEMLKTYIKNLAYGDPNKIIATNAISTDIIREQLKKKNATGKFFYNTLMLAQWATQVNAAVPTVFRQALEPLALAGSFNPRITKDERMYAMGQFLGGWEYMSESWKALYRAFKTDKPAAGYAKYNQKYASHGLKEVAEIRRLHTRLQLQMQQEGANPFEMMQARMWGLFQTAFYHPYANLPTRGLMATDEAARVTAGIQIASGRAYRDASQGLIQPEQIKDQTQIYLKQIFHGPPANAVIKDPEVKAVADRITMQTPMEIDDDSSLLDKLFAANEAAAQMSPIHRLFAPFNKVALAQLQQEQVSLAAMSFPGSQTLIGWGKVPGMKKYKEMYDKSDPTQKLALESQVALAQYIAMGTIANFMFGGTSTGTDVRKGEPSNAWVVPAPWTRKGEVAIGYEKFSPYSVVPSMISNVAKSFASGAIKHEEYVEGMLGIIFGYAVFSLQRSILQGQADLAEILDVTQFKPWTLAVADVGTNLITPGVGREVGELINPFKTITTDKNDILTRVMSGLGEKGARSFYSPPMYDIYAKKPSEPDSRVAMAENANPLQRRMSVLLNMLYPGNVTETDYSDPVMGMMRQLNYEMPPNYTDRLYSAYLNKQQQSDLRKNLQGRLYKNLGVYLTRNFERNGKPVGKYAKYLKLRKELGKDDPTVQERLASIQNDLENIHFVTKLEAAAAAGFGNDPVLRENIEKARRERLKPEISSVSRPSLFAQAAQEPSGLAQAAQKIIDFA